MGKRVALCLVAVITAFVVARWCGPQWSVGRFAAPIAGAGGSGSSDPARRRGAATGLDDPPPVAGADLAPPMPHALVVQHELEQDRAPYYDWVRRQGAGLVAEVHVAEDDPSVVSLYLAQDDSSGVPAVVSDLVSRYARHYGFVHARIYLPNPADPIHRFRLYAEADFSEEGWRTFVR